MQALMYLWVEKRNERKKFRFFLMNPQRAEWNENVLACILSTMYACVMVEFCAVIYTTM